MDSQILAQIEFLIANLSNLLIGFPNQRPGGLLLSILLALFGVGIGFLIALAVGSGRGSRIFWIRWISRLYIEIFRGLPLILLLVLVYQVLGGRRFGLDMTPRTAAMITLALYSGAYQAEIVYAGLNAIPKQLVDSFRVIGGSPWQVFFWIKMRYAIRVMLPAFLGQAISLFKDTSVVVIIGVADLMTVGRAVLGSDVKNLSYWVSLYLFIGFIYFIIAFGISKIVRRSELAQQSNDFVYSLVNF
ncbi:MAG: ABC transporter permease subunit [Chloroflexi bacterium]|nr:ABC transporter permease subunit [Chloroflexota bacterium]